MKSLRSSLFSFLCLTAIALLPANLLAGPPPGPYTCNKDYIPPPDGCGTTFNGFSNYTIDWKLITNQDDYLSCSYGTAPNYYSNWLTSNANIYTSSTQQWECITLMTPINKNNVTSDSAIVIAQNGPTPPACDLSAQTFPVLVNSCGEHPTIVGKCTTAGSRFSLKLNNGTDDVVMEKRFCCRKVGQPGCENMPEGLCPQIRCNMGCTSVGEHKFTIFNRDLADTNAAIHKYNPQILFFPYKKNGKQYLYNTKPVGIDSQQTSGDIKAYDATKNKYTCRIKGEYVNTATYHGGPDTWGNYQEPRLELTYYSRNNTVSCKSNVAGVEFVAGGGQYKTTCNNGTSICYDWNYRTQPLAVLWANKGCDKASYDVTCSFSQNNLPAPAGGDCDGVNACGIKPDRVPLSNVYDAATGGFYRMRWDPHFEVNANDSGWHQATICCCGTDNTDCCVPTERPVIVE
ncbi:MAG: hypothetical protein IT291_03395 [Deltaproteobacteria bacterium]|nr:hypothetical protein [Deltaproteobacteria bacterium]